MHDQLSWSPDVVLIAATDLDLALRSNFALADGEFILTLIGKSQGSQVLNREAAALLELFRVARAESDAIEALARAEGHCMQDILPGAMALISHWRARGILVSFDGTSGIQARTITRPHRLGKYRVRALVRSGVDTDLYMAEDASGRVAALKIATPGHEETAAKVLEREGLALQRLAGVGAPAFIERGSIGGRPFLAREWVSGIELDAAARRLRMKAHDCRYELLQLCRSVAGAYAAIHRMGVIHGDVHPTNALMLETGEICILDFGLAHFVDAPPGQGVVRRGFLFYLEPECAEAMIIGVSEPPPTTHGETFTLAALLYYLLTGQFYLDFGADRAIALRQIAIEPARPFSALGLVPWPDMERVLHKALRKEPSARYSSIDDLEAALRAIPYPRCSRAPARTIEDAVGALADPRHVLLESPSASVAYGAAGIAYVFRRAACVLERPQLLAAAELWIHRAWKEAAQVAGFLSPMYRIDDGVATPASLYYGLAGIHVVAALVGQTIGDLQPLGPAIAHLAGLRTEDPSSLDAMSGVASALFGAALLVDLRPPAGTCDMGTLIGTGQRLCEYLTRTLSSSSPASKTGRLEFLGAAHGWAGALRSLVRWHCSTGIATPPWLAEKLHELGSLSILPGKLAAWTISSANRRTLGGWCHGAGGYVGLWADAYSAFHDETFMVLAVRSAERVWNAPERSISQLCCGLAGQAEALLTVYRLTGETLWIDRARQLAKGIDRTVMPRSLLRGGLGAVLLDLDLAAPDTSGMPLFDPERL